MHLQLLCVQLKLSQEQGPLSPSHWALSLSLTPSQDNVLFSCLTSLGVCSLLSSSAAVMWTASHQLLCLFLVEREYEHLTEGLMVTVSKGQGYYRGLCFMRE